MTGLRVRLRQQLPIPLDVELECAPGELLALVGPSGSGKTTVLRCIAGLHDPASGRVECNGECWLDTEARTRATPQRRRIGMVFQHYALFPHMSALANVATALGHLDAPSRPERARELLALVNMEGLENRRPARLSGGQRQRVALARALAREPAALLLDEPLSAVDQLTRRRLQRELAQLRQTIRMPMVLVTHDLDEAQVLSDRICVLHRGRSLQTGPTREVMRRPVSAEVARLVDQRNVFSGRVLARDDAATRIGWAGLELDGPPSAGFEVDETVDWLVPQSDVVLHRRHRPSRGEHENPVSGKIVEMVLLGDDALVTMQVGSAAEPLSFVVSEHVARRNALAVGERATVSLIASGIHLMKRSGSR